MEWLTNRNHISAVSSAVHIWIYHVNQTKHRPIQDNEIRIFERRSHIHRFSLNRATVHHHRWPHKNIRCYKHFHSVRKNNLITINIKKNKWAILWGNNYFRQMKRTINPKIMILRCNKTIATSCLRRIQVRIIRWLQIRYWACHSNFVITIIKQTAYT